MQVDFAVRRDQALSGEHASDGILGPRAAKTSCIRWRPGFEGNRFHLLSKVLLQTVGAMPERIVPSRRTTS